MSKFADIQLTVASEQAIAGIQKHVPKISLFAKSFSGRAGSPYNAVAVPVFANLSGVADVDYKDPTVDKYCSGEQLEGQMIPLNKQFVKSYALTDYEVGSTDSLYLADGARAIADQLTLEVANYVFGTVLSSAEITVSASTPSTKAGFAGLLAATANAGANPYDCVVALNANTYSTLLGTLDSYVYGGPEAVRDGVVPGLYGFRGVVLAPTMPADINGFIIPWESIGVVSRWNKPAVDGYEATWVATDDKTGFSIGYRVFEHLCRGTAYIAGDVLCGAKLLAPSKIVKLV